MWGVCLAKSDTELLWELEAIGTVLMSPWLEGG
jgi:hypothetical protein